MKKLMMSMVVMMLLATTTFAQANDYRDLNTLVERSGFDTALHVGVGYGIAWMIYVNGSGVGGYAAGAALNVVIFRF